MIEKKIGQSVLLQSMSPSNRLRMNTSRYAALCHYLIATVLFAVYGDQVCPFLETISPIQLMVPLLLAYPLRELLVSRIVNGSSTQVKTQLIIDFALFIIAGIGLAAVNWLFFDAPWHSNAKAIVGMAILGLFVAIDLALLTERQLLSDITATAQPIELGHIVSFSKKFSLLAILIIVSMALVLFLVVNKDLDWLLTEGLALGAVQARTSILFEIALIMGTFLIYSVRIVLSYAKNVTRYLEQQTAALAAVAQGDLTVKVPVVSQDEFGLMARDTNLMIERLLGYQNELKLTRDASILALASLAETRDNETGAHILRTQRYVKVLAEHLSGHPDFSVALNVETIELLYKSAPLHDVGKVGIVDSILLKPGKLTDDEFVIMKTHAQLGSDALLVAEEQMGSNSFLRYAREIALTHHEKWDGSGYPNALRGDDIPLSGRLMALADVYDALLSKRVYKPAFSHQQAKEIILKGRGSHFDPRVVVAFEACEMEFVAIAEQFKDAG